MVISVKPITTVFFSTTRPPASIYAERCGGRVPSNYILSRAVGLVVGDGSVGTSRDVQTVAGVPTGVVLCKHTIAVQLVLNDANKEMLNSLQYGFGGIGSVYDSEREVEGEIVHTVRWAVQGVDDVRFFAELLYEQALLNLSYRTKVRVIRLLHCMHYNYEYYEFLDKLGSDRTFQPARLLSPLELSQADSVIWPWRLPKPTRFTNAQQVVKLEGFEPFLVGVAEAESSFFRNCYNAAGILVYGFSIGQADDRILVAAVKEFFQMGSEVYQSDSPNYPDNYWSVINSDTECCMRILNFFRASPFMGHKAEGFGAFARSTDARSLFLENLCLSDAGASWTVEFLSQFPLRSTRRSIDLIRLGEMNNIRITRRLGGKAAIVAFMVAQQPDSIVYPQQ